MSVQLAHFAEKTKQLNTVEVCDSAVERRRRDPANWCLGLDGKWRPNTRTDTTDRDIRIVQLRDAGNSIREIASEIGCSVGTVHRVLKRCQP